MAADGTGWRRVVPSPRPLRLPVLDVIRSLLDQGVLVIAAGGGGIPVVPRPDGGGLQGVEAVIDKDRCGGKLANELDADGYIILTDGGGIWQNFGKPDAREMSEFFTTSSSCLMCVYIIIRT